MKPAESGDLRRAIRSLHGCDAEFLDSHNVIEAFEGKPAWIGEVHRFRLISHPTAQEAYAWSHPIDGTTKRRYVAVLRQGPIDSPGDAVRASMVQEIRDRQAKGAG